jgi:hypothetical protein
MIHFTNNDSCTEAIASNRRIMYVVVESTHVCHYYLTRNTTD